MFVSLLYIIFWLGIGEGEGVTALGERLSPRGAPVFSIFFIIGCRAYWLGEVLLTQMETQRDIHQRAADDLIEAGLDLQVA